MPIEYCVGTSKYDAHPDTRTAGSFSEFTEHVLALRSPRKHLTYICAPMGPDDEGAPRRGKDYALPRQFLCLDLDGCRDYSTFRAIVDSLDWTYDAFWYTTSSHTNDSPRARIVLHLNRLVSREEGKRLGVAVELTLKQQFGDDCAKFDRTVYRAEQPVFTPLVGCAEYGTAEGEPIDVDGTLTTWAEAIDAETKGDSDVSAAEQSAAAEAEDPIFEALSAQDKLIRQMKPGMWAVECPFADEHTSDSGESSTVYLLPHFGGYLNGNFECKHAHCVDRTQEEYVRRLGLEPSEVRTGGGTGPVDFATAIEGFVADESAVNGAKNTTAPWLQPLSELAKDAPPVPWLIRRWLQADALCMVHGPSTAGKTFFTLDWALTIAAGLKKWDERRVWAGPVVYLAGEGHRGLVWRARAWAQERGVPLDQLQIVISRSGRDLNTLKGLKETIADIRAAGINPCLICVDTLHRFLHGDENSAQDAKTMLDACAALMRAFNCSVLLVHHTGVAKDAQSRARGSSAWRAALDIEVSITVDENSGVRRVEMLKSKDAELAPARGMELVPVVLDGAFEEGDEEGSWEPVTSAVVAMCNVPDRAVGVEKISPGVAKILEAFDSVVENSGAGVSRNGLRQSFFDLFGGVYEGREEALKKAWSRGLKAALEGDMPALREFEGMVFRG